MKEVILHGLERAPLLIWAIEHLPIRLIFFIPDATLMVLCAGKGTSYFTVDFEKLPPIGSCSQHKHLLRHLSLIFVASLAKIKGNVEPNHVLELTWRF